MRKLILVSSSVVLFSVATAMLFGCSSSTEQAADEETEEAEADENLSGDGKKSASPATTSTSSTEPAPAADTSDGGATWGDPDAAAPAVDPTAPQADLSMCRAGSVAETESNDSATAANPMPGQTFSFCGSLASSADVDFVTFTLPADTRSFSYGVSFNRNGIDATITAGAQGTFRLNQAVPILPGQKYVVRIAGAQAMGYRFDVNIGK